MPVSIETIQRPKPTDVTIETPDGEVKVTYDRNAMTDDLTSQIYTMLIGRRLSRVLLAWDVIDSDGQPWQPRALDNIAHWQSVIRHDRQQAHEAWVKLKSQRDALTPEAAAKLPSLPDEPTAPDAPITVADRRAAYAHAWKDILDQLPPDFKQAIDGGILDDFLGARWRIPVSEIGLPPKAKAEKSPGLPDTPTA